MVLQSPHVHVPRFRWLYPRVNQCCRRWNSLQIDSNPSMLQLSPQCSCLILATTCNFWLRISIPFSILFWYYNPCSPQYAISLHCKLICSPTVRGEIIRGLGTTAGPSILDEVEYFAKDRVCLHCQAQHGSGDW